MSPRGFALRRFIPGASSPWSGAKTAAQVIAGQNAPTFGISQADKMGGGGFAPNPGKPTENPLTMGMNSGKPTSSPLAPQKKKTGFGMTGMK